MEENKNPTGWHRPYIESQFKGYDYRSPERPWELHCANKDGIRNCAWQMRAFHLWWILEKCQETGEIGLAVNMEDHPLCLGVHTEKNKGHLFSHYNSIHKVLEKESFPLIIASAVIPAIECIGTNPRRCDGLEIVEHVKNWSTLLKPGGVIIAAILDNTGPTEEGRTLLEHAQYNHAWTVKQFERYLLPVIVDKTPLGVREFDTLKNGLAFNLVLEKG